MRPIILFAAWVTVTALMPLPAIAAPCLDAAGRAETAQGRLSLGHFKDAADRPESAYILGLAKPACLTGSQVEDKVETAMTIHIYSMDEALGRRIKSFVGREVRVAGRPFGAITAHHHAPIVMDITRIDPL
jgi:hypothetical protein